MSKAKLVLPLARASAICCLIKPDVFLQAGDATIFLRKCIDNNPENALPIPPVANPPANPAPSNICLPRGSPCPFVLWIVAPTTCLTLLQKLYSAFIFNIRKFFC